MIRFGGAADADAIAALHAASWRSAYRGFADPGYLDGQAGADLLISWSRALAAPPAGSFLLLDEEERGLRAFVSVKLAVEPGYDAFIYSLHVDPARRGGGIGRRLLGLAVERLIAQGHRSVALRAFDGNPKGIAFYRRLGAVVDGHGTDDIGGVVYPDTLLGWRDLPALARACAL